jgi:cell volume regulation protein A
MVSGEITLADLAAVYGIKVDPAQAVLSLADYFDINLDHAPKVNDTLPLDEIVLVARSISGHRVNLVGLRLPEEDEPPSAPPSVAVRSRAALRRAWSAIIDA